MTSDDNFSDAVFSRRWPKVLEMYKENRELRTKILDSIGTALHYAVLFEKEHVVKSMVDLVCGKRTNEKDKGSSVDENGDEKNLVLGVQNEEGNTPLHLAAFIGSVKLCEKISEADSSLISKCNNDGETPLFLAALYGHKKAFLCLHYKYIGSGEVSWTDIADCIKRDNQDTILHCAIERKDIDLAIDIVLLYKVHLKEMMVMRNKNGLSPLHLLAETPSIFESTDLPDHSFIIRLLYHLMLRVEKKQPPTWGGLKEGEHKRCLWNLLSLLINYILDYVDDLVEPCWTWIKCIAYIIFILLVLLVIIPLTIPLIAERWFHKVRDMKEKYTWSVQIIEELLQLACDEDMSANLYEDDNAAGHKIVDTPLMIATKNGVTEMVRMILRKFPSAIKVVNEEKKNVVLLAAEKRQTKVYQILCQHGREDKRAFSQVDKDGNTALHLAAMPDVNLNCQTTTVEEFNWFELVKHSVPFELWGRYNCDEKTAEEIFRKSYKEHITSDRQWLNQTSQTCSLASTLVASMAFSSIMADNFNEKNYASIWALSLSLTSTICFLAIIAFHSQSRSFWRYFPFLLQLAILTMFSSIVSLWISLMFNGKALVAYAILGSPIAILTMVSLPIFIGPTLVSMFNKVPPLIRNSTRAIRYLKPQKKEHVIGTDTNEEPTSNPTLRANSLQAIGRPRAHSMIKRSHTI